MNPDFLEYIDGFGDQYDALLACNPFGYNNRPPEMPQIGVYLFSEDGVHLYVGRSNRLRARYLQHCRPGSRRNQANFAFRLACEALNVPEADGQPGVLAAPPEQANFPQVFLESKIRVGAMQFRFVEEQDQRRQALLEIYCSIVLHTPHNVFDNH